MSALIIKGIDHPAVAANDVEQLADWYCAMFGYEKWFHHRKPVWMLRAPDGTLLEVMPIDDTARPERTTWTPVGRTLPCASKTSTKPSLSSTPKT